MQIKTATLQDLHQIAECHATAFPDSLSTAMGKAYLRKMLSWYVSTNDAFLFFLEDENQVVGYCGGMTVDPERRMGSASSMAQHSFNHALRAFLMRPWLLFHKEVITKYRFILKNIVKRIKRAFGTESLQTTSNSSGQLIDCYCALVVIGVRKNLQGGGYGGILLEEFENQSLSRGLSKMLLTVRTDNIRAIKAYEKNGWTRTESNSKSTTMRKTISR